MQQEDDDLDPGYRHNLSVVAGWDRYRWMSWLLEATDDRGSSIDWSLATTDNRGLSVEPLRFDSRADLAAAVSELYGLARENVRRPMREGLADALATWNRTHYSLSVLTSLAYIAAALQAPEALPKLLEILRLHHGLLTSAEEDEVVAAEILLSVIGGYPPEKTVEAMFSDLLMDNTVARELTALLAITVCKSSPGRFVECFNRYYERRCEPEEFFDDGSIVAAFAEVVPVETRNPLVPQLVAGARTLWMEAGKAAEVVTPGEIVPPDSEGRPAAIDTEVIPPRTAPSYEEDKTRYEVAFDDPDEILEDFRELLDEEAA